MKTMMVPVLLCGLAALPGSAAARPPEAGPARLALVVGSNRPGPGQQPLRFAQADAQRFLDVLTELGGFRPDQVRLLRDPGRAELVRALDEADLHLRAEVARGAPALFTFYYSGHARSNALSLGPEELPLEELRARLTGLPAGLTLAILDACQAGSISAVKGVEPAEDFSHNSVSGLAATGVAIMASSTGSELSQESSELGASFFTHHLVSGLRGPADLDQDGRVTLSEAYRYAYHRTLVATSATAVGRQHVTLETELTGRGETVLTFPERATARLRLPAGPAAEVLVVREPGGSVVAELLQAEAKPLTLALPPGGYSAHVRVGSELWRCGLSLPAGGETLLELTDCAPVEVEAVGPKGELADEDERPRFGLELSVGGLRGSSDPYQQRLLDFGFEEDLLLFALQVRAGLTWRFWGPLHLVLGFATLDAGSYTRGMAGPAGLERSQRFAWEAYALGLYLRGELRLLDGWLVPYLQAGGGLSLGLTRYQDEQAEVDDRQTHVGYQLGVSAGLQVIPWRHLGGFVQAGYTHAPAITNLLGDRHDSGGFDLTFGLRGAF